MRRHIIYILSILLVSALFWSCSSYKRETTMVVDDSPVYGVSEKYFSVVPGTYRLEYTETSLRIKVKLKLKHRLEEIGDITSFPKLQLLDDAEEACCSALNLVNEEKFGTFLQSKVGAEADFLFLNTRVEEGDVPEIMEKVKNISIEKMRLYEHLENLLDKVVEMNESVTQEDLEDAVEAGKAAIEVSKSALNLLDQLAP